MSSTAMNALVWRGLGNETGTRAASDEVEVSQGFWKKLRRSASKVPFAEDAVAAYYAAFDTGTPLKVRAKLLGALAYFVIPVDAIPDVLPVLGYTDDAALILGTLKLLSDHVLPHHQSAAHNVIENLQNS